MKWNCKICIQTYWVSYDFSCLVMWFGITMSSFSDPIISTSCVVSTVFWETSLFSCPQPCQTNPTIFNLWFLPDLFPEVFFPMDDPQYTLIRLTLVSTPRGQGRSVTPHVLWVRCVEVEETHSWFLVNDQNVQHPTSSKKMGNRRCCS